MIKKISAILGCSLMFMNIVWAETKTECLDNADFFGYATTISSICGYEPSKKYSDATALISKSCVAKYGNKLVFNASMAAVHEVKAKIQAEGRSKVCSEAYNELEWYFNSQ